MRKWAFLLGAAAAGAAVVVVSLALQQQRRSEDGEEVPEIIADCFARINRLESELQRLKSAPGPPRS